MIRQPANIKPILPMKRQTAAEIATLASRYECTFTLESRNVILNAKSMLDNGACLILEEKDLDSLNLIAMIEDLINDDIKLRNMSNAAKSMSHVNAAADIARLIYEMAGK